MARQSVYDRFGNEIYLTDERWEHIIETHDEMREYRGHVFETLRTGRRSQDVFDPSKYKYAEEFPDLLDQFTHVVVIVKFSWSEDQRGIERANNFILTAYQVSRGS